LQVIFRTRATNYRTLLRKMIYEDKASYDSTPPCTQSLQCPTQCAMLCRMSHVARSMRVWYYALQRAATLYNILQHTAPYCKILQDTATHDNTLQHSATQSMRLRNYALQHTATYYTYYNVLQYTATQSIRLQCYTLQHTATHYDALQHTTPRNKEYAPLMLHAATHNTLQHTAPHARTHPQSTLPQENMIDATHCNTQQHTATYCTHAHTHAHTHAQSTLPEDDMIDAPLAKRAAVAPLFIYCQHTHTHSTHTYTYTHFPSIFNLTIMRLMLQ